MTITKTTLFAGLAAIGLAAGGSLLATSGHATPGATPIQRDAYVATHDAPLVHLAAYQGINSPDYHTSNG